VEVRFENLAAQGGFTLSATRTKDGAIRDVRIVSNLGEDARMANPRPGATVKITERHGREQVQTAEYLCFPTREGAAYLLERR